MSAREAARAGTSGAVLLAMILIGSIGLWAGVPLLWLWLASWLYYLIGSLGAALGISLVGVVLTIGLVVRVLSWLSHAHGHLREARGLPSHGTVTLEAILVTSAFVAVVVVFGWLLFYTAVGTYPAYG